MSLSFNSSQVGSKLKKVDVAIRFVYLVSIPHRQAQNKAPTSKKQFGSPSFNSSQVGSKRMYRIYSTYYCQRFQFLIGRLKTQSKQNIDIFTQGFNSSQVGSKLFDALKSGVDWMSFNSSQVGSKRFTICNLIFTFKGFNSSQVGSKHVFIDKMTQIGYTFQFLIGRLKTDDDLGRNTKNSRVSIPHRQAQNLDSGPNCIFYPIWFQFLIGRLKTYRSPYRSCNTF